MDGLWTIEVLQALIQARTSRTCAPAGSMVTTVFAAAATASGDLGECFTIKQRKGIHRGYVRATWDLRGVCMVVCSNSRPLHRPLTYYGNPRKNGARNLWKPHMQGYITVYGNTANRNTNCNRRRKQLRRHETNESQQNTRFRV